MLQSKAIKRENTPELNANMLRRKTLILNTKNVPRTGLMPIFVLFFFAFTLSACTLIEQPTVPPFPTVEFLYPLDNTTVLAGTDVQIQVLARDENGSGIARVELLVDDQLHQEGSPVERPSVLVFTVEMNWLAEGDGLHALTATAYREDGTASNPVTIRLSVISATEESGA